MVICTIILLICSGTASAWLSGYDHRMAITVNSSGASTLSYYQFNFTNDTNVLVAAGHMQASGADCRITDLSDNLIPFWNETAFNASGTKIWANATTLAVGDNTFYMYYGNSGASDVTGGDATFPFFDGFESDRCNVSGGWDRYASNPILLKNGSGWEKDLVYTPRILKNLDGTAYKDATNRYWMYYSGGFFQAQGSQDSEGVAYSTDLINWTREASNPVLPIVGGTYYAADLVVITVIKDGGTWHAWFEANRDNPPSSDYVRIGYANSTDGLNWNVSSSPILSQGPADDSLDLYACAVMKDGDTWKMWYMGHNAAGHYNLMYATADNPEGPWTKYSNNYIWTITSNYISPSEVWKEGATYYMTYLSQDLISGSNIEVASSPDGINWTHLGTVLDVDPGQWDADVVYWGSQINVSGTWYNFYSGHNGMAGGVEIGFATSSERIPLTIQKKWDCIGTINFEAGYAKLNPTETEKLRCKSNYGVNYSFRWRADTRNDGGSIDQRAMGWMDTGDAWSHYLVNTPRTDKDNWNNGGGGNSGDNPHTFTTGFKTYEVMRNGTSSMIFEEDGIETTSVTTSAHIITANMMPYFYVYTADTDQMWIDWTLVRKYTATEPTSSLGAEENAAPDNDIVLGANEYALVNNWTTAQTYQQIDNDISNAVCFSYYNSTSGLWEGYRAGYTYNHDAVIPANCSIFVFVNAQTTVSATPNAGGVTIQNATWFYSYLPGSASKTLTEIETAMNVDGLDVWSLYGWNNATQAYTTTGSYSVSANEGYAVYVNTTGEYTP